MDRAESIKEFKSKNHLPITNWVMEQIGIEQLEDCQMRVAKNRDEIDSKDIKNVNLENSLSEFYFGAKDWIIKWKLKSGTFDGLDLEGSISIMNIRNVLDWKSWDLYSVDLPHMKNFTLLDYFYDEAAVGFYLGAPEKGLFYFEFDADPKPINLDFEGYVEMVKFTKGAAYWQLGCIEPIDRSGNKTIEKLNKIDPTITVEGFYELYESLRIDK